MRADNLSLILLYTLLPVYIIHQYEEHAHGRFVDFFNSTIGKEYNVLTEVSVFWINILEVWVLFIVSVYLAKCVAIGVAFVPVYATIFNGFTHAIASIVLEIQPWSVHGTRIVSPLGDLLADLLQRHHQT